MKPSHRSDLKYTLKVEFLDCETGRTLYGDVIIDEDDKKNIELKGIENFTNDEIYTSKEMFRYIYDLLK